MPDFTDMAYHWMKSLLRFLKYKVVIKDFIAVGYSTRRSQRNKVYLHSLIYIHVCLTFTLSLHPRPSHQSKQGGTQGNQARTKLTRKYALENEPLERHVMQHLFLIMPAADHSWISCQSPLTAAVTFD